MKAKKLYSMLTQDGWFAVSQTGSHIKMRHKLKPGVIIFPMHGSSEVGTGLEKKLLKQAGIKK